MRAVPLFVAAALALPAAAHAKGPVNAAVCGPDRCEDVALSGLHEGLLAAGERELAPPPRSYYRVELRGEGLAPWTAYYEPVSGLFASRGGFGWMSWSRLPPRSAAGIPDAAKGLRPYPAPRVTAAFVGDRRVSGDPSTYLALLRVAGEFHVPTENARFELIRLEAPVPNPWTETTILYYPDDRVLFTTAGLYVRVPADVAEEIEAARPLGAGERTVIPWVAVAIAGGGALVLLALRGARRGAPSPERPARPPILSG